MNIANMAVEMVLPAKTPSVPLACAPAAVEVARSTLMRFLVPAQVFWVDEAFATTCAGPWSVSVVCVLVALMVV